MRRLSALIAGAALLAACSVTDPVPEGSQRITDAWVRNEPVPLLSRHFGEELTADHLKRALKGRKAAIKLMLLDQGIVAGLGNIYVCEALWHARIDPRKAAGKVMKSALERLVPAIRDVLQRSLGDGGSTLRDYAQPDGQLGYFATRFAVYGREAKSCLREDGGMIRRFTQGGRSTWYCPKCQR